MKISFSTLTMLGVLLASYHGLRFSPKERQLLYKERNLINVRKVNIPNRILSEVPQERNLGMFGPGDDQIVKIKAKKDMLKRKIEMDNGKSY